MKTKLELVKEAYGDKYEACQPDENGWTHCYSILDKRHWRKLGCDYRDIEDTTTISKWRPIALKGIEDNGGWFSVKEHGFPKERGYYDFYSEKDKSKYNFIEFNPAIVLNWTNVNYTHWRPVDNRLPLHS